MMRSMSLASMNCSGRSLRPLATSVIIAPEKSTPMAVIASRMPSRVPLVWRNKSFSCSGCSVRVAEKTGTKALAKLPSAKKRRRVLGMRSAA